MDSPKLDLARVGRVEGHVEHFRKLSVDPFGCPDIAVAVDMLVGQRINRALWQISDTAERTQRGTNMPPDPRYAELEELCEGALLNLRRMLESKGVGP